MPSITDTPVIRRHYTEAEERSGNCAVLAVITLIVGTVFIALLLR